MKSIILSIDELWLKGKNQILYHQALKSHLKNIYRLHKIPTCPYRLQNGMIELESTEGFPPDIINSLRWVPGISSIQPAQKVPADETVIVNTVLDLIRSDGITSGSFAIRAKRSNKKFLKPSMDLARDIGSVVLEEFPFLQVHLKKPDYTVFIRVLNDGVFIFSKKYKGIGGLPVGTGGHLISLLSGGFDSPVASFLMSKRGCKLTFIFFYAFPFVSEDVKTKILDLMNILKRFQNYCHLYIIPFGDIQSKISELCKPAYRTILFRWYMMQTAAMLSKQLDASGILTGDALGQVSSQTIENMSLINRATDLPILRPLIGYNKIEILNLASQIETHDISILPHDDACSLFAAKHPVLKPSHSYFNHLLQSLDLESTLEEALATAEIHQF